MKAPDSPATSWSIAFLAQIAELGVRHVVVSPGSRSQALAFAAHALSTHPNFLLHLHVVIDERTAAFFSLGLAVETEQPVAMVCTSGSAPAHYFPALMEAKHSGLPIIAITADRPSELQGVGANQTTSQTQMFGSAVNKSFDVEAPRGAEKEARIARELATEVALHARHGAAGGRPGPVHLNVAFREPLSSALGPKDVERALSDTGSSDFPALGTLHGGSGRVVTLDSHQRTVVIAGHRAGPQAESLARELGAPLIAEVHSGARFGPHLIVAYRELLALGEKADQIERVVTVGRPTLSREVNNLLRRTDIEQVVWQKSEPEAANPSRKALVVDEVEVSAPAPQESLKLWVGSWLESSRAIEEHRAQLLDTPPPSVGLLESGSSAERSAFAQKEIETLRAPLSRRQIARLVWEAVWPQDRLVLGSSRIIREFDKVVPGKNIPVWSNRGVSGIDGIVATGRGIAWASGINGGAGTTRVVIGDVSFLHDSGSLLLDKNELESSRIQVIVIRDGGGSIFDSLEARQIAPRDAFDRVMFTPANADLDALAAAYGWKYRLCRAFGDFQDALADVTGPLLVDCVLDREEPGQWSVDAQRDETTPGPIT